MDGARSLTASSLCFIVCFFFFNDTATTEIYTLSLHDALPIYVPLLHDARDFRARSRRRPDGGGDRKSTRLNSSHTVISYAVFCLKKKHPQSNRPGGLGRCCFGACPSCGNRDCRGCIPLPSRSRPSRFFFNNTAPPEIYSLSLLDALPI